MLTLTFAMSVVLLTAAFVATFLAVWCGYIAYRASSAATPRDRWNARPRTQPVLQAEMMRLGATRDRERRRATAFTVSSGAWWLAATASAATAATNGFALLAFSILAVLAGAVAFVFVIADRFASRRLEEEQDRRADAIQRLEDASIDPATPARTVAQQLVEWSANRDLLVYAQHSIGSTRTTMRGRLHADPQWGYSLYASDWDLGPLDSVSPIRGIALNLGHYDETARWQPGTGTYGALCCFYRRAMTAEGLIGIVETLTLSIVDPFEVFGPHDAARSVGS